MGVDPVLTEAELLVKEVLECMEKLNARSVVLVVTFLMAYDWTSIRQHFGSPVFVQFKLF